MIDLTNPIVVGTLFASLAAAAFGLTTPFVQRFGAGVGPLTTASLLYLGAALGAAAWPGRRAADETRVRARHLPRLMTLAFIGAAVAPTLLAWGLQRVSATHGSLLLNAEAVFTVLLAAAIHREHVGGRLGLAVALMTAGGVVTVAGASSGGSTAVGGALAVVGAVFAWSLDNVLTRPFSTLAPADVVRVKALSGALLTGALGLILGEPRPAWGPVFGLLACGAGGYGASLWLYLLAQRRIGAGRTGSVFAVAPFVGALASIALGDRPAGFTTALAALLFVAGVTLQLTERHEHEHRHEPLEHDHAHRHDDGHHDHAHDLPPPGPHAHPHRHEPEVHAHPHGPDAHHGHGH